MTKKCCVSAHRETCSLSPIVISVYTSVATLAHGDILWQKKAPNPDASPGFCQPSANRGNLFDGIQLVPPLAYPNE